jgi:hypothetical protein
MNRLKKLDKIELVLFKPLDPKLVGLYSTLIRIFPMFDFPNNDSQIVILIDIDEDNNPILKHIEFIKNKLNNLHP